MMLTSLRTNNFNRLSTLRPVYIGHKSTDSPLADPRTRVELAKGSRRQLADDMHACIPVHEASCCVDSRLLLSPAPSHQKMHQVVASWGCEGGCRRFCRFEGGPLQQPARRRACVPSGRTPVCAQCCSEAHLQQEEV